MTRVWIKGMDDVTELLSHYRSMDKKLQQLADELESICIKETSSIMLATKAKRTEDVPELQKYVEQREQKREALLEQLKVVSELFDQVYELLNMLTGVEYQVILHYYFNGYTMPQVAKKVNYSLRHCWRIHDRAIYKMAKDGTVCHSDP